MADLALFDFDGTISTNDNFTAFFRYAVDPRRIAIGSLSLVPLWLAYKMGAFPAPKMRAHAAAVGYRGRPVDELKRLGERYAREVIPGFVRPVALERIRWHQNRGDVVAVVSASLDVYLSSWCADLGLDLISTELEARDGFFTGRYRHGDCSGAEKAKRVRERYDLGAFGTVHAYGDTHEDNELLALASKRFFRWVEQGA